MKNKNIPQTEEEWGNIELPNFSDKELFDPKLNVKINNKSRSNDPSWKEKTAKAAINRSKQSHWKQSIENRIIDYTSIDKTFTKEAQQVKCITPWGEFISIKEAAIAGGIHEETLRRRCNNGVDGYWKEDKHKGKKRSKPIQTPFGIFSSKSEADAFAEKNKIFNNAKNRIQKYLKTDPKNYFYINTTDLK
jgi:hypothetical protein